MTVTHYPTRHAELQDGFRRLHEAIPEVSNGFFATHRASLADGALTTSKKELIALGIAIAVNCDGCIAFHVHDSLKAGATRAEILETIGVAVMMGGGPSMIYATEALTALDQFEG
jgi:AhpD family alkylhydroperoxidase